MRNGLEFTLYASAIVADLIPASLRIRSTEVPTFVADPCSMNLAGFFFVHVAPSGVEPEAKLIGRGGWPFSLCTACGA